MRDRIIQSKSYRVRTTKIKKTGLKEIIL